MNLNSDNTDEISISSINIPPISYILKRVILGGIFFILALPLLGDYGPWLFPIGRDVIFKLSIEFLLILVILLGIFKRTQGVTSPTINYKLLNTKIVSPITISLVLFVLIMAISTAASVQPEFSFWGNMYKNQGLSTWIHYILFFILLISFIKEGERWKVFLKFSALAASIVSLIALWQILQNGLDTRPGATMNNPNFLASYLILIIPLTLALYFKESNLIFLAGFSAQLLALLATQTRGGYLGASIALIVFAILYLGTAFKGAHHKSKFLIAIPILLPVFVYALILFTSLGQFLQLKFPDFTDRFLNREQLINSSGPRLEAWRTGLKGIADKPLLGYGPENFFVVFDKNYSGKFDSTGSLEIEGSLWETWFDKAHNFIFDIGTTAGLAGLIAYIGMFVLAMLALFKTIRAMNSESTIIAIALLSAFAGYLTQNLFGFDTLVPGIYLMFLFAYSDFLGGKKFDIKINHTIPKYLSFAPTLRQSFGRAKQILNTKYLLLSTTLIAFVVFIYSLKTHADMLEANHNLNISYKLAERGEISKAFNSLEKGLKYDSPPINPNLRRQYAIFALAYSNALLEKCLPDSTGSDPVESDCAELVDNSEVFLKRALELQYENAATIWPYFTRNYIYAAQIAHKLKKYEDSERLLKKATDLSPNRKSIRAELQRLLTERINNSK